MNTSYWASAVRSLMRNSRRPGFLKDVIRAGLRADLEPKAPARFLLDVYPEIETIAVDLGATKYRRSNLDPTEQLALAAIAQLRQPATIFEIGTYDGATTLLLARTVPSARILTLDLAPGLASAATVTDEIDTARGGVGSRFTGRPEAARIEQLFGDSRTFDFSPWFRAVDLVIVDAGHDYDCVAADTANAFAMLRQPGVIVWDDYTAGWPGVRRAVDESGRDVFRLAGTDLAVYDEQLLPTATAAS